MAILTKQTGNQSSEFEPCPIGDLQAVVADVVDLGYIEKTFEGKSQGLKPHISIVYQVVGTDDEGHDVRREDGKPYLVFGRRLVLSTNERSGFYKELCGILGKTVVDDMLQKETLDTENLIGHNVNVVVIHALSQDGSRTYANIESMKPWNPKYGSAQGVSDYTRRHEKEGYIEPPISAFEPLDGNARALSEAMKAETPQVAQRSGAQLVPLSGVVSQVVAEANVAHEKYLANQAIAKIPDNDPRMSNKGPSHKDYSKKFMAGEVALPVRPKPAPVAELGADEFDAFADEGEPGYIGEGANRQAALIEIPTAYPAN